MAAEHAFSSAVRDAVAILSACKPLVVRVGLLTAPSAGTVSCEVDFQVPLGSRVRAAGTGEYGVRPIETVTFEFSPSFPRVPPTIFLRNDFDRGFAHILPGRVDQPPRPCLVDIDIGELYQSRGLVGVVKQVGSWLRHAANGTLIDPKQGWEPIRRDSLKDHLVLDHTKIRGMVTRGGGIAIRVLRFDSIAQGDAQIYLGAMTDEVVTLADSTKVLSRVGYSLGLVLWAGKDATGQEIVAGRYLPETVDDFESLMRRADEYGCARALRDAVTRLEQELEQSESRLPLPLAVVFAVRRPCQLIGAEPESSVELCPYFLEISAPRLLASGDRTPVHPVAPQEILTSELLRTMSGRDTSRARAWVQLGAGSLGSKIAIHMARAGVPPACIIDRGFMSTRHAARHSLTPPKNYFELFWNSSKALALSSALDALGGQSDPHTVDITTLAGDASALRKLLPKNSEFLVNSTAALGVRETLEGCTGLPRVVETTLYADGALGVLAVEGQDRNPSSGDLATELYARMYDSPSLRASLHASNLQRVGIGQGCGTLTMPMPDSRLAQLASPMATRVLTLHDDGFPSADGLLALAQLKSDGLSLDWVEGAVSPSQMVTLIGDRRGWRARVLSRAHQKIIEDVARWPSVETGGILIGRLSHAARVIYVADILPAPPDSTRSASEFVLGTSGAEAVIRDAVEKTGEALYCVGTWHSHLSPSNPSSQDQAIGRTISMSRLIPSVLLVRTPVDYRGLIATSDATAVSGAE